jgi:hypothetical protein
MRSQLHIVCFCRITVDESKPVQARIKKVAEGLLAGENAFCFGGTAGVGGLNEA